VGYILAGGLFGGFGHFFWAGVYVMGQVSSFQFKLKSNTTANFTITAEEKLHLIQHSGWFYSADIL